MLRKILFLLLITGLHQGLYAQRIQLLIDGNTKTDTLPGFYQVAIENDTVHLFLSKGYDLARYTLTSEGGKLEMKNGLMKGVFSRQQVQPEISQAFGTSLIGGICPHLLYVDKKVEYTNNGTVQFDEYALLNTDSVNSNHYQYLLDYDSDSGTYFSAFEHNPFQYKRLLSLKSLRLNEQQAAVSSYRQFGDLVFWNSANGWDFISRDDRVSALVYQGDTMDLQGVYDAYEMGNTTYYLVSYDDQLYLLSFNGVNVSERHFMGYSQNFALNNEGNILYCTSVQGNNKIVYRFNGSTSSYWQDHVFDKVQELNDSLIVGWRKKAGGFSSLSFIRPASKLFTRLFDSLTINTTEFEAIGQFDSLSYFRIGNDLYATNGKLSGTQQIASVLPNDFQATSSPLGILVNENGLRWSLINGRKFIPLFQGGTEWSPVFMNGKTLMLGPNNENDRFYTLGIASRGEIDTLHQLYIGRLEAGNVEAIDIENADDLHPATVYGEDAVMYFTTNGAILTNGRPGQSYKLSIGNPSNRMRGYFHRDYFYLFEEELSGADYGYRMKFGDLSADGLGKVSAQNGGAFADRYFYFIQNNNLYRWTDQNGAGSIYNGGAGPSYMLKGGATGVFFQAGNQSKFIFYDEDILGIREPYNSAANCLGALKRSFNDYLNEGFFVMEKAGGKRDLVRVNTDNNTIVDVADGVDFELTRHGFPLDLDSFLYFVDENGRPMAIGRQDDSLYSLTMPSGMTFGYFIGNVRHTVIFTAFDKGKGAYAFALDSVNAVPRKLFANEKLSDYFYYQPQRGSAEYRGVEYRSKLIFPFGNSTAGYELFITDGSKAGTRLFADIWDGPVSSNPSDLMLVENRLICLASTKTTARAFHYIRLDSISADLNTNGQCLGERTEFELFYHAFQDSVLDWRLDFGNGLNTSSKTASFPAKGATTYARPGTYQVIFTLRLASGLTDSFVYFHTINQAPSGTISPGGACDGIPFQLNFVPDSVSAADGTTHLSWEIETVGTRESENPKLRLSGVDTALVTLSLKTDSGCTAVISRKLNVEPWRVDPISVDYQNVCLDSNQFEMSTDYQGDRRLQVSWWIDTLQLDTGYQLTFNLDSVGAYKLNRHIVHPYQCKQRDELFISVYNHPNPIGAKRDSVLCEGDSQLLFTNSQVQVNWWYRNTLAGSRDSLFSTISEPGTANWILEVIDSNQCRGYDTISFEVLPVPNANFMKLRNDSLVELLAADTNLHSYQWQMGDGSSYTDARVFHRYPSQAVYTVELTVLDSLGCSASTSDTLKALLTSLEEELAGIMVAIWPNPASKSLKIRTNVVAYLAILDLNGKMVADIGELDKGEQEINLHRLKAGTYLISIQSQKGSAFRKLIIGK